MTIKNNSTIDTSRINLIHAVAWRVGDEIFTNFNRAQRSEQLQNALVDIEDGVEIDERVEVEPLYTDNSLTRMAVSEDELNELKNIPIIFTSFEALKEILTDNSTSYPILYKRLQNADQQVLFAQTWNVYDIDRPEETFVVWPTVDR